MIIDYYLCFIVCFYISLWIIIVCCIWLLNLRDLRFCLLISCLICPIILEVDSSGCFVICLYAIVFYIRPLNYQISLVKIYIIMILLISCCILVKDCCSL